MRSAWELLRSLSGRFYLSLLLAVAGVWALAVWVTRDLAEPLRWVAIVALSAALVYFGVFPLLIALFRLAYGMVSRLWRPGPWRSRRGVPAPPMTIRRPDSPDRPPWIQTPNGPHAGTLDAFLAQDASETDDTQLRIAIVLAGGGGKGVYQAGALRALWEFLSEQDALRFVRAVTGTSIGAWNALFWLADRVRDDALRDWWLSAEPGKLAGPTFYIPVVRNYLLDPRPWRRQFRAIFGDRLERLLRPAPPYYYLTRTNVPRARLECTTNRDREYRYIRRTRTGYEKVARVVDEAKGRHRVTDVGDLERAVFTSMDIPPAFKRMLGPTGEECEDGGVIDNLPIRYATRYEGCNLLFVLPLNATFAAKVSSWSILRRLFRVMDVRQGTLERDAIRDIGLYNEVIHAGEVAEYENLHVKPVTTFCICPEPPLEVGTYEFWKMRRAAAEAYQLMYEATRDELRRFDFSTDNRSVWMARVRADGAVTYTDFTLR